LARLCPSPTGGPLRTGRREFATQVHLGRMASAAVFIRDGDSYQQSFPVFVVQVTGMSVVFAWLYLHTNSSLLLLDFRLAFTTD
jgi:hypothetical protein